MIKKSQFSLIEYVKSRCILTSLQLQMFMVSLVI